MGYYSIKFAIIALCVNLAWSHPTKFSANSDVNEINIITSENEKQLQDTQTMSVEGILNVILSPMDTEFDKEAKKLIAQHLATVFVSSLKPAPFPVDSKFSKAEKNYFTPSEEADIMKRIMAALTDSKTELVGDTNLIGVNKPLKETPNITLHLNTNTTEGQRIELATDQSSEINSTNQSSAINSTEPISEINLTGPNFVYPPTVRDMIEDFIINIRRRNFTGVVEIGLKLASFQTIGQGLREAVNRALLNALNQYLLLNFRLNKITQRLRNPQISFIDAFRIRRSDLKAEDKEVNSFRFPS